MLAAKFLEAPSAAITPAPTPPDTNSLIDSLPHDIQTVLNSLPESSHKTTAPSVDPTPPSSHGDASPVTDGQDMPKRKKLHNPPSGLKRRKTKAEPPPDFGEQRFAELQESLRAKFQHMEVCEELCDAWCFFHVLRKQSFPTDSDALSRLQQVDHLHAVLPSDPRTKQLRHLIDNWETLRSQNKAYGIFYDVARRMHLVELAAKYLEKSDASEATSRETVSDQFVDELFPEAITVQGTTRTSQQKKYRAKKRGLEYWIRVGKLFLEMVKWFGHGVLLMPARRIAIRE